VAVFALRLSGEEERLDLQLQGRKALVCGASKGLGLAIAECLAAEGAAVGLVARSREKLSAAVKALEANGGKGLAIAGDLGKWEEVEAALDAMRRSLGEPDILVVNSGGPPPVDVTEIDAGLWRAQFEVMVLNQMRLAEAVLPAMRKNGFGRILAVSSTSIVEPFASLAISNSLRAALAGWLKTLASKVAADGVTVNLLLPGSFATERIEDLDRRAAEEQGVPLERIRQENRKDIPAGRYGEPREFGAIAAFLASPRAAYITGTAVRIDGGATRSL
jgi:3-oxoacyl-[acyl-carrier protein] reductase